MNKPNYPVSRIEPVTDVMHGEKITDNYRWLEDQNSPQTREWLKAQMDFTMATLGQVPGRARIEKRLGELLRVDAIGDGGPPRGRGQSAVGIVLQ